MDWSALIPDTLKLISDRLHHCFDYVNFRMVCTSWRSAVPPKKFPPLLILPPEPDFGNLRFFDPADDGVHSVPLPEEARNKIFCSTSRGWLALKDETTHSMFLVNPFTPVRYPLPPTPQRVYFASHPRGAGNGHWITQHECINEIIMSASPDAGADCIVMAQLGSCDLLVFCRLGDAVWTDVDTHYEIDGVAFCDGKFYALDRDGSILILELGPDGSVTLMQSVLLPFESEEYKFLEWNGELLLVGISFQPIYEDDDDLGPFIFKSEGLGEELTLSRTEGLGDNTMFVSENHYFGFVGREVHGCKRNCINLSETAYDGLEGVHQINCHAPNPGPGTRQMPHTHRVNRTGMQGCTSDQSNTVKSSNFIHVVYQLMNQMCIKHQKTKESKVICLSRSICIRTLSPVPHISSHHLQDGQGRNELNSPVGIITQQSRI